MNTKEITYFPRMDLSEKISDFSFRIRNVYNKVPLHWHDYFECEIVLEGSAEHKINNLTETISPGSAYILSHFDSHEVTPKESLKIFSIHFNESAVDESVFKELLLSSSCRCVFDCDEFCYVKSRIKRLLEEERKMKFHHQMTYALITEILILIMRKFSGADLPTLPTSVQKAQIYTLQHFRKRISLKTVAKELSLTPKYLGSVFKERTGVFYNDYLNGIRIRYACNLLAVSEFPVKEIAFSSGFASTEYFLDVFKKITGQTPSAYRKRIRK